MKKDENVETEWIDKAFDPNHMKNNLDLKTLHHFRHVHVAHTSHH